MYMVSHPFQTLNGAASSTISFYNCGTIKLTGVEALNVNMDFNAISTETKRINCIRLARQIYSQLTNLTNGITQLWDD